MTAATSTVRDLARQVRSNPADAALRLVYADSLQEAGDEAAANVQRLIAGQQTAEGTEVVTVARRGSDTARCGNNISVPIWVTAVYRAERRADGLLTWRRVGTSGYGTAGQKPTGPMIAHAKQAAEDRGVEYREWVRHGVVCA
jgi:uncharacterized protein (TIGR02996 family)